MTIDRTDGLLAITAHARSVPATHRAALAAMLREANPRGALLIETCHRIELHGPQTDIPTRLLSSLPPGTETAAGLDAARQLVRLAVGLDSAVIGEDQVLHQLRVATQRARAANHLQPELDRLIDLALRAGRVARSWLPVRRSNLAESAIASVCDPVATGRALVVGSGEMGRLAAVALRHRQAEVLIASRNIEHARSLAAGIGARAAEFDPGADEVAALAGVVIALEGPWAIGGETAGALAGSRAWVIDLSSPCALAPELASSLGPRLTTIDDLARVEPGKFGYTPALIARLNGLVEQTVGEYARWLTRAGQRRAAEALAEHAQTVGTAALGRLLDNVDLDDQQRRAVEQMVSQLTRRLLRDPLEQLSQDPDGRHARAARELFRL